ncbi:hypothetical protein A2875_04290 [Candidatus Gottesmanbacteria bacterium RIFCSPHIGHO2_01_FULL_46_14]|uniref:Uncharacterized protein n=3 Tax=Candidatus Gottesmaniibacteriota TaxID=1752720 RepID=A0A1F5ZT99_9BACT|nr:MAG: hypothetical protein UY27_C0020G0007 [Candidatus Gottesmanbacteria bacterium GW2011_GWA1_48_13]OGG15337.1 MAG: hypothetical protein A2875_04290 [Candidatus Gottesmanbacteria bacterium RIFCSPHIGHO2_01_FULL_46_14]OGG30106.1 MAG: hypothetical protein A2971_04545 [Candidatus Gottesmanbacteria bacterium RIFCSPLOWO2_01_FULL_46_21]
MEWGKLVYLLVIILIGYLPYKAIQRYSKDGFASISTRLAFLMTTWFLLLSTLLINQTPNLFVNTSLVSIVGFGITVLLWAFAPYLLRRIGKVPTQVIIDNPKSYLIRTQPKMYMLKFCEILFQQAKFAYLLFVVLGGLPQTSRIWWFSFIIIVLHLYNMYFVRAAMLFFLVSIPMGPLFSILILNGYITVAMTIHLWFYLILVSWYRLRHP